MIEISQSAKSLSEFKQVPGFEEKRKTAIRQSAKRKLEQLRPLMEKALNMGLIDRLPQAEQDVLKLRFLSEAFRSQQEVADSLGINQQKVCELQKKGIRRINKFMSEGIISLGLTDGFIDKLGADPKQTLADLTLRYGDREVGNMFGVSREIVRITREKLGIKGKYGRKNTQEAIVIDKLGADPKTALAKLSRQMSDFKIAEELGVSRSVVYSLRRKFKIGRRGKI